MTATLPMRMSDWLYPCWIKWHRDINSTDTTLFSLKLLLWTVRNIRLSLRIQRPCPSNTWKLQQHSTNYEWCLSNNYTQHHYLGLLITRSLLKSNSPLCLIKQNTNLWNPVPWIGIGGRYSQMTSPPDILDPGIL